MDCSRMVRDARTNPSGRESRRAGSPAARAGTGTAAISHSARPTRTCPTFARSFHRRALLYIDWQPVVRLFLNEVVKISIKLHRVAEPGRARLVVFDSYRNRLSLVGDEVVLINKHARYLGLRKFGAGNI